MSPPTARQQRRRTSARLALPAALLFWLAPAAQADGVDVGKPSVLRNLVPAKQIEDQALRQYGQLIKDAAAKGALAAPAKK